MCFSDGALFGTRGRTAPTMAGVPGPYSRWLRRVVPPTSRRRTASAIVHAHGRWEDLRTLILTRPATAKQELSGVFA